MPLILVAVRLDVESALTASARWRLEHSSTPHVTAQRRCATDASLAPVCSEPRCRRIVRGQVEWTRHCRRLLTAQRRCATDASLAPVCSEPRCRRIVRGQVEWTPAVLPGSPRSPNAWGFGDVAGCCSFSTWVSPRRAGRRHGPGCTAGFTAITECLGVWRRCGLLLVFHMGQPTAWARRRRRPWRCRQLGARPGVSNAPAGNPGSGSVGGAGGSGGAAAPPAVAVPATWGSAGGIQRPRR